MKADDLIRHEREEQKTKHGFTTEYHDANIKNYANDELIQAYKFCVNPEEHPWPENWDTWAKDKILKKSRLQQWVTGGAFLLCQEEVFGESPRTQLMLRRCKSAITSLLFPEDSDFL